MTPHSRFSASALVCRLVLAACATVALTLPAHADSLQDAGKLMKQGQHAQALEQVDKYLSGKPKDAQGRFLKGLILTEMNKTNDAIAVFTKLTEDYPELPEPYNNLAVIYAQQKQFEKAKQALEMAIRTHPSYATAHENLGDIYTRMASQAYDKALQIDSSNSSAQSKLAMIREIMTSGSRGQKPAKPDTKPTVVEPVKTPEPVKVAEAPKPVEPPKAAEPVKPVEPPKPEAKPVEPKVVPAAKPEPVKAIEPAKPAEAAKPAASGDAAAEVAKSVERWLAAWSKKDVKGYLAAYAKDFQTPGGEARAAWEGERAKRINKPGVIQVTQEGLRVTVDGDTATAKFRQHYKSAGLKTGTNKVLVLVRRDGQWQIQQEKIGN